MNATKGFCIVPYCQKADEALRITGEIVRDLRNPFPMAILEKVEELAVILQHYGSPGLHRRLEKLAPSLGLSLSLLFEFPEPMVRTHAMFITATLGPQCAALEDHLRPLLESEDIEIKILAAASLARVSEQASIQAMECLISIATDKTGRNGINGAERHYAKYWLYTNFSERVELRIAELQQRIRDEEQGAPSMRVAGLRNIVDFLASVPDVENFYVPDEPVRRARFSGKHCRTRRVCL